MQVDDPAHLERLKQVFRAANKHRMAIAVHMRASISRKRPYGAAQAQVFLDQLLPAAPDVPVQVAHLAGSGPGYDDPPSDSAMEVLAKAAGQGDPRTRKLWFDVASVADLASRRRTRPGWCSACARPARSGSCTAPIRRRATTSGRASRGRRSADYRSRRTSLRGLPSNLAPYFR